MKLKNQPIWYRILVFLLDNTWDIIFWIIIINVFIIVIVWLR